MGWFSFDGSSNDGSSKKSETRESSGTSDDGIRASFQSTVSSLTGQAAEAVHDVFPSSSRTQNHRDDGIGGTNERNGVFDADSVRQALVGARETSAETRRRLVAAFKQADDDTQLRYLFATCSAAFVAGIVVGRASVSFASSLKRITQMTDLSSRHIGPTAPYLRGRAIKVSDGDTLRFYHTPTFFHRSEPEEGIKKVSDISLPIRVCTIDTPETAKFGKPGQPFGEEAKQQLSRFVEGKIVQIQILTLDQYGRGVAQVRRPRLPWIGSIGLMMQYADEVMLKAGMAEVYRGSGAVYGHKGKDAYIDMEQQAKQNKVGIWSMDNRESAAEYKQRTKGE